MREKLTKAYVDRLIPSAARLEVWDTQCKGLYLRVEPHGRKVYLVYARAKDGRQIRKSLGDHGQISVETVREEAQKVIHEAKFGDPDKLLRCAQGVVTLRVLCQAYLDEHLQVIAERTGKWGSHTNAKIALFGGRLDQFLDRNVESLTTDQMEAHYKSLLRTSIFTANATRPARRFRLRVYHRVAQDAQFASIFLNDMVANGDRSYRPTQSAC